MATIELPYSASTVRTVKQSKEFLNNVLLPAADLIANCSFKKAGLYQVSREQNISCSEEPGDWSEIGFRAVRLDPLEQPRLIQFNIWAHNATDTAHIPLPEAAIDVISEEDRNHYIGAVLLEPEDEDEDEEDDDEDEEDYDYEDIVIEQHDFYLNNQNFKPVRDLEYTFSRDGDLIWQESHSTPMPTYWAGDTIAEQRDLMATESRLRNEFDALDLQLIGGVLARLGLIPSVV